MQGRLESAPDLARRMKVEAHCGERGKSSQQGEAGLLLRSPCSLTFLCLDKTFPATPLHFGSAKPLLRFRERNPTFSLKWKHQHHGAALPRNGHHHKSSSRSEPPVRWQSPAELVDHRGEVSTPIFLFQRRPERYPAVYEEDGRDLDVGGIPKRKSYYFRGSTLKPLDLFSIAALASAVCNFWTVDHTCCSRFRLLIPRINQMCRFPRFIPIFKVRLANDDAYEKLRAVISATPENFLSMPRTSAARAACWFFNVIILDSLNISMHTYALADAMLALRCLSPCWFFYRSAWAFKRTLQCHKRNNSGYKPSAMTEEVLGCPLNIELIPKSVANILGIYFKCRKGRGPYLSFWSSPRRKASLWNYVRFLTLGPIFPVIVRL